VKKQLGAQAIPLGSTIDVCLWLVIHRSFLEN